MTEEERLDQWWKQICELAKKWREVGAPKSGMEMARFVLDVAQATLTSIEEKGFFDCNFLALVPDLEQIIFGIPRKPRRSERLDQQERLVMHMILMKVVELVSCSKVAWFMRWSPETLYELMEAGPGQHGYIPPGVRRLGHQLYSGPMRAGAKCRRWMGERERIIQGVKYCEAAKSLADMADNSMAAHESDEIPF